MKCKPVEFQNLICRFLLLLLALALPVAIGWAARAEAGPTQPTAREDQVEIAMSLYRWELADYLPEYMPGFQMTRALHGEGAEIKRLLFAQERGDSWDHMDLRWHLRLQLDGDTFYLTPGGWVIAWPYDAERYELHLSPDAMAQILSALEPSFASAWPEVWEALRYNLCGDPAWLTPEPVEQTRGAPLCTDGILSMAAHTARLSDGKVLRYQDDRLAPGENEALWFQSDLYGAGYAMGIATLPLEYAAEWPEEWLGAACMLFGRDQKSAYTVTFPTGVIFAMYEYDVYTRAQNECWLVLNQLCRDYRIEQNPYLFDTQEPGLVFRGGWMLLWLLNHASTDGMTLYFTVPEVEQKMPAYSWRPPERVQWDGTDDLALWEITLHCTMPDGSTQTQTVNPCFLTPGQSYSIDLSTCTAVTMTVRLGNATNAYSVPVF